jgi:small redox-active disulfide protein 2
MMIIKVLGTGCAKCDKLIDNVRIAMKESEVTAEVIKVEDFKEIMGYKVMSTPALVIDDVVKIKGRVASVAEIKTMLAGN